jgi:hypothetical protein
VKPHLLNNEIVLFLTIAATYGEGENESNQRLQKFVVKLDALSSMSLRVNIG